MSALSPELQERLTAAKRALPIGEFVERHVKLSGSTASRNRRGQCPFHGSNSASFSIKQADRPEDGFAHCFGCQWHGDVVRFVQDFFSIPWIDALRQCEAEAGLSGSVERRDARPVARERNPQRRRAPDRIEPIDMARAIWRQARRDDNAARRYFLGRGVPERALTAERLAPFRYLAECPCLPWELGQPWPTSGPVAPALMAMVRVPQLLDGDLEFVPSGLHVTWLNPAGTGTMVRRKPWAKPDDPDPMLPKRRMLGPVGGGCIVLGDYSAAAHLFVGEGNETVLSAIGLAGAQSAEGGSADGIVGVATLSLDNLQGAAKRWKGGVWPLHAIEPDPERGPFVIPGHRGAVTGLVDSDMSPLRGLRDRHSGAFRGEAVVERKGSPIVHRAITGQERARICGELLVKGWRAAGAHPVEAVRAPAGMDFNDVAAAQGRAAA